MTDKEIKLEMYDRIAVCCNLEEFDPGFAGENDFIEVCEWKNGEGYDISINDRQLSFTRGELKAINYLVEYLNKE